MPAKQLTLANRRLAPHKAAVNPDFRGKTVLVEDTWDYVTMLLKRNKKERALFYWQQAQQFSHASRRLPNNSAPLTAYYCFLNAVKALLAVKNRTASETHGVSGESKSQHAYLSHELVRYQTGGVLAALCRYLGEPVANDEYTLYDLLYNLVYVHRAYNLTFASRPDLFTPVALPMFVKKLGSTEAWFRATIRDDRYANQHTINKLSNDYEQDRSPELLDVGVFGIRHSSRFTWRHGKAEEAGNLERLRNYHRRVRGVLFYIHGPTRLWYIKRRQSLDGMIDRSSLSITFAAMHRLSELARYDPMLLAKHLNSQHNWLLSEFIATAQNQFIDEMSSEITGQEFMIPGRRGVA